jgi:diketogulonate reductase-like aldo/keto reductase
MMREIGQAHYGKSPVQVALNWLMFKGVVPIPGAKMASRQREMQGHWVGG